ncbi:MAG TPA: ABC transporter permease [Pyrinomonadaceae bacterium]|nr:ABC transporter permease [Pyrinomonadaceae bacterium]
MPDNPVVVIEPRPSLVAPDFRDLWAHRELLYFLTWRDVKVRYKQTLIGIVWAVLQPVLMMLIFTLFFGKMAGLPSDGIPYSLFAYSGLLPWTFFAAAVTTGGNSVVNNAGMVTKVYFPRIIVPAAAVAAALVDFAVSFGVLALLMIFNGVAPTWKLLMLPVLVVHLSLLALGLGVWLSALNVKYRDIRFALPFIIQLWFFVSPIIYPVSLVIGKTSHPERWHRLLSLNPVVGIVEGFRAALFAQKGFDWLALAISAVVTLALLAYATFTFQRMEKSFADIV